MYTSDEHVSSYHYICVLILRVCVCVVLLVFWPRTIMYVSSYITSMCVLVLLYMRPHTTTIYVCSCSMPVLLLINMCLDTTSMCPHTTMYASSYHSMAVLILRACVSSYYYICVLILLLYMCAHSLCLSSYS